jgi:Tol biopolymer transport system component
MQRISWSRALVIALLSTSIAAQAQAPKASAPQANVREITTVEGDVSGSVLLPSGRTLIYTVANGDQSSPKVTDSAFTYEIATKRRTPLGTNMRRLSVSPRGDRLAFGRPPEDGTGFFLWTMPIDPKTGSATGQAQRVSLKPMGRRAYFSPDGNSLAFYAGPRPDGKWDLTLVPATGGVQRVVATYRLERGLGWSADGKSLYVERGDYSFRTGYIERLPLAGGESESLFSHTEIFDGYGVGVSTDARVALFVEEPDRFLYRTAAGVEGEVSVALPPFDDAAGANFGLDSLLRYTAVTRVRNQTVRVLDLTTGQARDLLLGNEHSGMPAWSPDGKRLAVLSGTRSHYDVAVMNADGSNQRRYPLSAYLDGWQWSDAEMPMPWSPDGRFLAFLAHTGPKAGSGPDDQHQLVLLDVNSGQTRVLLTSSAVIGSFVWRSDGSAIRAAKGNAVPTGWDWTTVEISLNGTERPLRDISAEFPRAGFVFASDHAVIVRTADRKTRSLVPLDGGAARQLQDLGGEPGVRIGNGTLVVGDQLLVGQIDASGEARAIKILSTVGDATRTLAIPFNGHHGVAHPDGKHIINVGKAAGDKLWKLFLVPLDGSASRLVGEIPRGTGGRLALSPDGKLLAYTSDGIPTSKIHEIDFSPALEAILKR